MFAQIFILQNGIITKNFANYFLAEFPQKTAGIRNPARFCSAVVVDKIKIVFNPIFSLKKQNATLTDFGKNPARIRNKNGREMAQYRAFAHSDENWNRHDFC